MSTSNNHNIGHQLQDREREKSILKIHIKIDHMVDANKTHIYSIWIMVTYSPSPFEQKKVKWKYDNIVTYNIFECYMTMAKQRNQKLRLSLVFGCHRRCWCYGSRWCLQSAVDPKITFSCITHWSFKLSKEKQWQPKRNYMR